MQRAAEAKSIQLGWMVGLLARIQYLVELLLKILNPPTCDYLQTCKPANPLCPPRGGHCKERRSAVVTADSSDVPRTSRSRVRERDLLEREAALRRLNDASAAAWPRPGLIASVRSGQLAGRDVPGCYYCPPAVTPLARRRRAAWPL